MGVGRRSVEPPSPVHVGLAAMLQTKARRDALDQAIVEIAREEPFAAIVGPLRRLRGVSVLTALGLCVEIGDWQRFNGRSIGAFLGLVVFRGASG